MLFTEPHLYQKSGLNREHFSAIFSNFRRGFTAFIEGTVNSIVDIVHSETNLVKVSKISSCLENHSVRELILQDRHLTYREI